MKARDYDQLGIPRGPLRKIASQAVASALHSGYDRQTVREVMHSLVAAPQKYAQDEIFGPLAEALAEAGAVRLGYEQRENEAPYRRFGSDLDPKAVQQMETACRLPVAVRGALMPDAHVGYGLPIGGVLATEGSVIPYAVGVDIACRMKLSVLDLPLNALDREQDRLRDAIQKETRFGVGAEFKVRRNHPVMDEDWSFSGIVRKVRDKAWDELGTSGGGNHFVEFGTLTVTDASVGLAEGVYVALLSHSGSRGPGAEIAGYFSRQATKLHPELPQPLKHLAWLELSTSEGQEYWRAMQLMGRYAQANHQLIHRHIARHLGADVLLDIENHHNFAWEETHDGKKVIVHRKGATPAGKGDVGIVPGSMATPGFVVRGRGNELSLDSCSHGAGRVMSRTQAKNSLRWNQVKPMLEQRGVTVISASLDEVPMVYKDIHEVMSAQKDLVDVLARFDPKLVKMAAGRDGGSRREG